MPPPVPNLAPGPPCLTAACPRGRHGNRSSLTQSLPPDSKVSSSGKSSWTLQSASFRVTRSRGYRGERGGERGEGSGLRLNEHPPVFQVWPGPSLMSFHLAPTPWRCYYQPHFTGKGSEVQGLSGLPKGQLELPPLMGGGGGCYSVPGAQSGVQAWRGRESSSDRWQGKQTYTAPLPRPQSVSEGRGSAEKEAQIPPAWEESWKLLEGDIFGHA